MAAAADHQERPARHAHGPTQASHDAWLVRTAEAPLEPSLRIIDPHHHLWANHPTRTSVGTYMLEEILEDVQGSKHNVVATCYMQVRAFYLPAPF